MCGLYYPNKVRQLYWNPVEKYLHDTRGGVWIVDRSTEHNKQ